MPSAALSLCTTRYCTKNGSVKPAEKIATVCLCRTSMKAETAAAATPRAAGYLNVCDFRISCAQANNAPHARSRTAPWVELIPSLPRGPGTVGAVPDARVFLTSRFLSADGGGRTRVVRRDR